MKKIWEREMWMVLGFLAGKMKKLHFGSKNQNAAFNIV